jgi:gluconolactonase
MRFFLLLSGIAILFSCSTTPENKIGSIERLDAELDNLLDKNTPIEILGEGFIWSEGPVWVEDHNMLLFSDVPKNTIYKWTEANGIQEYLTPSGFMGTTTLSREPGSNGLLLDNNGNLVLCQHGERRMAYMDAPLDKPEPKFIALADRYDGKRFNSPNDAAYYNGELYFTDPPYGLHRQDGDPEKEIPFQGVYKIKKDGTVVLLIDSLTRPNGIAFTPSGEMIVANSDGQKAMWCKYTLNDSSVVSGEILLDVTNLIPTEKGLPDGLKTDSKGNIFATGPGGVFIFNASGKLIGKIKLENASSNCALSRDEKTLYITDHMYLLRVNLK